MAYEVMKGQAGDRLIASWACKDDAEDKYATRYSTHFGSEDEAQRYEEELKARYAIVKRIK